jgi:hypothetical protein
VQNGSWQIGTPKAGWRGALTRWSPLLLPSDRSLNSMIHLLRSHCLDSISLIDRVPPILYGLVVAFPSSLATDQELFEISLTVLMRWGRIIWLEEEETRKGRMVLWKLIERALERKRVLGELREKGVEVVVSRVLPSRRRVARSSCSHWIVGSSCTEYHLERRARSAQRHLDPDGLDVSDPEPLSPLRKLIFPCPQHRPRSYYFPTTTLFHCPHRLSDHLSHRRDLEPSFKRRPRASRSVDMGLA